MLLHKNLSIYKNIFSYINERGTSSPDCKYKHMLENRAPPDKSDVLYRVLHIEFHGFNSSINVLELSHFGSCYQLQFLQMEWVPLNTE